LFRLRSPLKSAWLVAVRPIVIFFIRAIANECIFMIGLASIWHCQLLLSNTIQSSNFRRSSIPSKKSPTTNCSLIKI